MRFPLEEMSTETCIAADPQSVPMGLAVSPEARNSDHHRLPRQSGTIPLGRANTRANTVARPIVACCPRFKQQKGRDGAEQGFRVIAQLRPSRRQHRSGTLQPQFPSRGPALILPLRCAPAGERSWPTDGDRRVFHLFRPNLEFCRFERVRAVISIEPFGAGTFKRVPLSRPNRHASRADRSRERQFRPAMEPRLRIPAR